MMKEASYSNTVITATTVPWVGTPTIGRGGTSEYRVTGTVRYGAWKLPIDLQNSAGGAAWLFRKKY